MHKKPRKEPGEGWGSGSLHPKNTPSEGDVPPKAAGTLLGCTRIYPCSSRALLGHGDLRLRLWDSACSCCSPLLSAKRAWSFIFGVSKERPGNGFTLPGGVLAGIGRAGTRLDPAGLRSRGASSPGLCVCQQRELALCRSTTRQNDGERLSPARGWLLSHVSQAAASSDVCTGRGVSAGYKWSARKISSTVMGLSHVMAFGAGNRGKKPEKQL